MVSHFEQSCKPLAILLNFLLKYVHFYFNMADFSDSEDEIPYPLPPTTVAPMTTTATAALIVFNIPTSSSACNTTKLPKNNNFCQRKGEEAFGKETKTS
jgi:hypothetical protein